jgi:hypothetical protein
VASTRCGRQAGGGFGAQRLWSSSDGAALPLLEALVDAESVVGIGEQVVRGLHVYEPRALQEIDQQQRGRDELRLANVTGREKSAYQG